MYGAFVRAVRNARGLPAHDQSRVSGIAQANISAIENRRRTPSADTLNPLVVACGFDLTATAGDRTISCPLPDDPWPPPGRRPTGRAPDGGGGASAEERAAVPTGALDAVDAARGR